MSHASSVLTALAAMLEHRVHGLALIDDSTTAVVGSFSASDLKGLTMESFGLLETPIAACVNGLRASVGLVRICVCIHYSSDALRAAAAGGSRYCGRERHAC